MKSKIWSEIENSKKILLLTHENPDGDAISSVLGFYHMLVSINKSVDMVVIDIPKMFNFMTSIDKIVDNTNSEYDLCIVLDCATEARIGQKDDLLSKCKKVVCIDHHVSNTEYGDYNYVDGDASSCCQVIYYLFKDWNIELNKDICDSLICGVLTDTNGFNTNSVDAKTFRLAADAMDLGVDIHNLYKRLLIVKSIPKHNLMKIALDRLELINDGKIAFTYILKDDFDKVEACKGEHEGIVEIGRSIEGVEVSVFIREDDDYFTVSLRSSGNINVNNIASAVGGGGHFMAAGCKISGSLNDVKDTIINEIMKVFF